MRSMQFYCKRLQNDGALNFVQFFLDHSTVYSYNAHCKT